MRIKTTPSSGRELIHVLRAERVEQRLLRELCALEEGGGAGSAVIGCLRRRTQQRIQIVAHRNQRLGQALTTEAPCALQLGLSASGACTELGGEAFEARAGATCPECAPYTPSEQGRAQPTE